MKYIPIECRKFIEEELSKVVDVQFNTPSDYDVSTKFVIDGFELEKPCYMRQSEEFPKGTNISNVHVVTCINPHHLDESILRLKLNPVKCYSKETVARWMRIKRACKKAGKGIFDSLELY